MKSDVTLSVDRGIFVNCVSFAFQAHVLSCWLNYRWTPTTWESGRTWETSCCWKLRRRSTGCKMTGTAGTSRSRPRLESTWNSPASAGLWMTRKWCCAMGEVGRAVHLSALFFRAFLHPSLCLVCCSIPAPGWQDQLGQAAQTERARTEEENLQARPPQRGQFVVLITDNYWHLSFVDGRSGSQGFLWA